MKYDYAFKIKNHLKPKKKKAKFSEISFIKGTIAYDFFRVFGAPLN